MKRKEPSRITILQEIFECFQQVTQWVPTHQTQADYSEGVTKYLYKAEALIEILEVNDCGSTGGFDPDMAYGPRANDPTRPDHYIGLFGRFLWLVDKYGSEKKLEESCGFNIEKLTNFFLILNAARGNALASTDD